MVLITMTMGELVSAYPMSEPTLLPSCMSQRRLPSVRLHCLNGPAAITAINFLSRPAALRSLSGVCLPWPSCFAPAKSNAEWLESALSCFAWHNSTSNPSCLELQAAQCTGEARQSAAAISRAHSAAASSSRLYAPATAAAVSLHAPSRLCTNSSPYNWLLCRHGSSRQLHC